jgi:hypothetical protein
VPWALTANELRCGGVSRATLSTQNDHVSKHLTTRHLRVHHDDRIHCRSKVESTPTTAPLCRARRPRGPARTCHQRSSSIPVSCTSLRLPLSDAEPSATTLPSPPTDQRSLTTPSQTHPRPGHAPSTLRLMLPFFLLTAWPATLLETVNVPLPWALIGGRPK